MVMKKVGQETRLLTHGGNGAVRKSLTLFQQVLSTRALPSTGIQEEINLFVPQFANKNRFLRHITL